MSEERYRNELRMLAIEFPTDAMSRVANMVGREPEQVREMLRRGAERVSLEDLEDLNDEEVVERLVCAGDDGGDWSDDRYDA